MAHRNNKLPSSPLSSSSSRESACAVLGIPVYASEDEGRRAYKSLARAFHPDKGGDVTRFQSVQRAYEYLAASWARDRDDRRRATEDARKRGGGEGGRKKKGGGGGGGGTSSTTHRPNAPSDWAPDNEIAKKTTTNADNANSAPAAASTSTATAIAAVEPSSSSTVTTTAAMIPRCNLKQLGDEALAAGDFARAVECYDAALAYARVEGMLTYASVYYSRRGRGSP